jgi:hypothetical protein
VHQLATIVILTGAIAQTGGAPKTATSGQGGPLAKPAPTVQVFKSPT